MNGYNFTDRVRQVLQFAREEAARLAHEYVGTEHLLLALIREGEGVACAALTNLGVDLEEVREAIEVTVKPGHAANRRNLDLPYTSRAKKVLELSMKEARQLNHNYVGTEHLLLGVLGEAKGIAAQVLGDAGITLEAARIEVLHLLGVDPAVAIIDAAHNFAREADKRFKRAIALIELHQRRFGAYPETYKDLQFLEPGDYTLLSYTQYQKVQDGYALDVVVPTGIELSLQYPAEFWRGLGIRRTNVPGGPE